MVILLGFLSAIAIGITGVGGGVLVAPILIVFLGIPPLEAVTVALLFAAAVKLLVAPAYLWRGQVDFRVLGKLLAGGVPGVLLGSLFLQRLNASHQTGLLSAFLGVIIASVAAMNLVRLWRGPAAGSAKRDRSGWLSLLAFPIGAEVGFSSAGAGALGTVALMSLTTLAAGQIVATDLCFGLVLSGIGGGLHWSFAHATPAILWPLLAGGIVGGIASVYLAGILPARPLRAALCVWLMVVGIQLCWKGIGM